MTQPKLAVSSSPFEKLEKTNFRMDAGWFETTTLSIELAIDWHANRLSHLGSVKTSEFDTDRSTIEPSHLFQIMATRELWRAGLCGQTFFVDQVKRL